MQLAHRVSSSCLLVLSRRQLLAISRTREGKHRRPAIHRLPGEAQGRGASPRERCPHHSVLGDACRSGSSTPAGQVGTAGGTWTTNRGCGLSAGVARPPLKRGAGRTGAAGVLGRCQRHLDPPRHRLERKSRRPGQPAGPLVVEVARQTADGPSHDWRNQVSRQVLRTFSLPLS